MATAFGMARYGYGLLLPDIKRDLVLGAPTLGAIGTLGYVAYVLAALCVARCVARAGPRATVVAGGLLAIAGTIVIAVAVAAPIAILAGDAWRSAYLGFAACAALSTLLVARTLPGRSATPVAADDGRAHGLRRAAVPMLAGAVLIGLGSAAFWTFAVDHVRSAGLDQAAGRTLLGVAGVASVLGIGAADVIRRLGARRPFALTALVEAVAIATVGVAADHLIPVLIAGAGSAPPTTRSSP